MKTSEINVELIGYYGSDEAVANAARVSFAKDASNYTDEQNGKLIKYLADHGHLSPFNHAFLSFRVKAPIFVARQLVKHKFLPWNEVSRRYVDDEPEFYCPPKLRARADNAKQGSSNVEEHTTIPFVIAKYCLEEYQYLLDSGFAPEEARMVLPLNTMTEWIWSGTLGAWLDMLKLRLDPHTQQETRIVAEEILKYVSNEFPISTEARLAL